MTPRRTQAERREQSKERLEEAAIAALVDGGPAGATVQAICAHAGLSQGALYQHYPNRAAVLTAAVQRLYDRLLESALEELRVPAHDAASEVRRAVEVVWRSFHRVDVAATLALYAASRTDSELRSVLSPMLNDFAARLGAAAWATLPPPLTARAETSSALVLLFAACQSFATSAAVEGAPVPGLDDHLNLLARLLSAPLSETP